MSKVHCPRCGQNQTDAFIGGELYYCRPCKTTWAIINATSRGWPARALEDFELSDPIQAEPDQGDVFLYRTGLEVRL